MSTIPESATTIQTDRVLWTDAVERVSTLAHAKLPETLHGRLERATALVLSGGSCTSSERIIADPEN